MPHLKEFHTLATSKQLEHVILKHTRKLTCREKYHCRKCHLSCIIRQSHWNMYCREYVEGYCITNQNIWRAQYSILGRGAVKLNSFISGTNWETRNSICRTTWSACHLVLAGSTGLGLGSVTYIYTCIQCIRYMFVEKDNKILTGPPKKSRMTKHWIYEKKKKNCRKGWFASHLVLAEA